MTVLIGFGALIGILALLLLALFLACWLNIYLMVFGLVALTVGMAGMVGMFITSPDADPAVWVLACLFGGPGCVLAGMFGVEASGG